MSFSLSKIALTAARGGTGGTLTGHLPGGPGTHADMLRLALSKLDVDVALTEIVHFLQHDERLPARTRKAVQFLHGLRQQMVHTKTHATHPELFDCPLAPSAPDSAQSPSSVAYSFRDIRSSYGEAFHETFWPVFRAFNCVLPAHAPEAALQATSTSKRTAPPGVSAFMPPADGTAGRAPP